MSKYTFYDVTLRDSAELTPPVTAAEFWETTLKFVRLTVGAAVPLALAVLGLSYVREIPALSWLVPFILVILALGGWLALIVITQFLNMQYTMVEAFAQWQQWQETRREIANHAMAQPVMLQTNVDARGIGNEVQINNAPVENIRIMPVHTPSKVIDGIPAPALAFFVDQYSVRGWGEREWIDRGIRLPSMKEPVDYDLWRRIVGEIEKVEGIPPVKPRTKIKPILPLETIKRKLLTDGTG